MNRALRILLLTNGLVLIAGQMLGPIYAFFVGEIGGDILAASSAWAVYAVFAGFAIFLFGKWEDRLREKEIAIVLGYGLTGVGFLGYLLVQTQAQLFVVQAFLGIAEALYAPSFDALYAKYTEVTRAASQWGLWEAMNYFSIAIGAVVGGFLAYRFGFPAVFIAMSVLCFGSAVFLYLLPRKTL